MRTLIKLSLALSLLATLLAVETPAAYASSSSILVTSGIASAPDACLGCTFFDQTFSVPYVSGSLKFSKYPDGSGAFLVDDIIQITVTHPDGTTLSSSWDSSWNCRGYNTPSGPLQYGGLFAPGTNSVRIVFKDRCGVVKSATPVYMWLANTPTTATVQGTMSPNPSSPQVDNCNFGKFPVNCATGNFWHTFTDLSIPGRGPALNLSRTYNSLLASTNGPFGYGWSFSYGINLTFNSGNVTVNQENGTTVVFTKILESGSSVPNYVADADMIASLVQNSNGSYTFTRNAKSIFNFDSTGRLMSIQDANSYTTTLTYLTDELDVTNPAGLQFNFFYSNGLIQSVSDSAGRSVSYGYDTAGNLSQVNDVTNGVTKFTYYSDHTLKTMQDPNQTKNSNLGVLTNYYGSPGKISQQTDGLGRSTYYYFGPSRRSVRELSPATL